MGAFDLKGEIKRFLIIMTIVGIFIGGFVVINSFKINRTQNTGQATTMTWEVPEAKVETKYTGWLSPKLIINCANPNTKCRDKNEYMER